MSENDMPTDEDDQQEWSFTRSYQGDPDDWTIDDPKHGINVPDSVRVGGATRPMEREELGENGVALRCDNFAFECEVCGAIRRFATNDFKTMYYCRECEDTRWFRFDWDLNRRSSDTGTDK